MENQENQALDRDYKIYIPSTHQFVPVTKEVYYNYYRPIWRIRKQAQKYGQCMCPRSKLWRCDGVLDGILGGLVGHTVLPE